jgi:transcriptional regulator with XRE-family HTH domain
MVEFVRRSKGLNQTQLGQLAKIGQAYISLLEMGRFIPTPDQLARIARALGAHPDTLLKPVTVQQESDEREVLAEQRA